MPPPSSSLRLRIPEKGISRRGRKKGSKSGYAGNDQEMIHREHILPLELVQKIVKASCTRRVSKDVYPMINEISSDFFEVREGSMDNI